MKIQFLIGTQKPWAHLRLASGTDGASRLLTTGLAVGKMGYPNHEVSAVCGRIYIPEDAGIQMLRAAITDMAYQAC